MDAWGHVRPKDVEPKVCVIDFKTNSRLFYLTSFLVWAHLVGKEKDHRLGCRSAGSTGLTANVWILLLSLWPTCDSSFSLPSPNFGFLLSYIFRCFWLSVVKGRQTFSLFYAKLKECHCWFVDLRISVPGQEIAIPSDLFGIFWPFLLSRHALTCVCWRVCVCLPGRVIIKRYWKSIVNMDRWPRKVVKHAH